LEACDTRRLRRQQAGSLRYDAGATRVGWWYSVTSAWFAIQAGRQTVSDGTGDFGGAQARRNRGVAVKSFRDRKFHKLFALLPKQVQELAVKNYLL